MVECHYRSAVGSDPNLNVWFYVRLWAGGRMWIRAIVENGYIGQSPATKSYAASVTIGGATVYSASLSHHAFSRWTAEGWIGGNPGITPTHNNSYLISTRLVPNYWKRNPSSAELNALPQSYTPMQAGALPTTTADGGFGNHIGLIPLWEALYVTTGDPRAFRSATAASSSAGVYALVRRPGTNRLALPSAHASATYEGGGNGTETLSAGGYTWDVSHAPNLGYVSYLVTGDYFHLETHGFAAQAFYFCTNAGAGSGTGRVIRTFQSRGVGWGFNIIGTFCGISPTEGSDPADAAVVSEYRSWLAMNYQWFADQIDVPGQNQLGTVYQYSTGAWSGNGSVGPWMTDFWVQANGLVSECEPLADPTQLIKLRNWMYRWVVGRLGPTGSSNYHFSRAAMYGINIDPTATGTVFGPDERSFFDSWGDVWTATHGSQNAESTNTLQGNPGFAAEGYWGNLLPAIAYAVDHAAPGAAAGWARLTGATNWSSIETSLINGRSFNNTPIWGVVPRGFGGT